MGVHSKQGVCDTYVADTNALDLSSGHQRLHLLPGLTVVPAMDDVARTVG